MKTLGSIESFTGGLFASTIINTPGASKYFKGAVVSYSNDIKEKLGIDISNGVMNKETALAMSKKGKTFLGVDIVVAFTGNAGPSALEGLEAGEVFIAINDTVYHKHFSGDRNYVRKKSVDFALQKVKEIQNG